jgi:plastocyanin
VLLIMNGFEFAVGFAGTEIVISQKGKAFSKDEVTIAPGDTIVFKNDDDTSHNVFSTTENHKFNAGITKIGAEAKQLFSVAGELEVRCAIHPKMKLKVSVKK